MNSIKILNTHQLTYFSKNWKKVNFICVYTVEKRASHWYHDHSSKLCTENLLISKSRGGWEEEVEWPRKQKPKHNDNHGLGFIVAYSHKGRH